MCKDSSAKQNKAAAAFKILNWEYRELNELLLYSELVYKYNVDLYDLYDEIS